MESNSQQAIYIAVNLLIFIALLTVSLGLLTATLNICKKATDIVSDSDPKYMQSFLEENPAKYEYTYEDILSIYSQSTGDIVYKVKYAPDSITPNTTTLEDYITYVAENNKDFSPMKEWLGDEKKQETKFYLTAASEKNSFIFIKEGAE